MAKAKKPIYCWDTTTLLAWLKEEATAPLPDIALVVQEIDANEAILIISTTVYTEILEGELTDGVRDCLDKFLARSNVVIADLTKPIAQRAAQIRTRGHQETPKRKVKTPDAQMVATALALNADVLHSLDG